MAKNGQVPVLIGNKTSKNVYSGWRKITEMLEANNIMLCPGKGSLSCFLVRVLVEYINFVCSLESKLFLFSRCCIRTLSRNQDI